MIEYKRSTPLFTIAVASQLVGLHPRTLMLYEKAGLIAPFRTKTERRRYSQKDIDKIKFIHYLTSCKAMNLAGIKIVFAALKIAQENKFNLKAALFSDLKT